MVGHVLLEDAQEILCGTLAVWWHHKVHLHSLLIVASARKYPTSLGSRSPTDEMEVARAHMVLRKSMKFRCNWIQESRTLQKHREDNPQSALGI